MTAYRVHPADLEPSLVGGRTYLSRRRLLAMDGATLLVVMLILLYVVPARYVLPGLTDVGRPALVVGLLLWCWWALGRLSPRLTLVGPQPMRWAVMLYLLTMLGSYAVGMLRGVTTMEANGADRALLSLAAFTGVVLVTADAVPTWARLRAVLQALVWCAAFTAVVGILQSMLGLDVTQYLTFPGLQAKGIVMGFEVRGAGVRIASTTAHYIEFGTVMATALPFGIHFARFATTQRARRAFGLATLLIAVAVPLTISRTGILALAATIIVMFPVWSWRLRFNIIAAGVAVVAAFMVIKPGLLGTIRDLFLNASQDTSVTARTERYTLVARYFSEHPWLGRGTGTWLAPQYQILDNEWLTFALTNGIVGVAILTAVHLVAIVIALVARRRVTQSLEDRELCTAFVAAQLISLLVAATFDSLSFTTFSMTLALMMGCCGTVWRLTHPTRAVRTSIVVPGA